jgi:hypothetical protein
MKMGSTTNSCGEPFLPTGSLGQIWVMMACQNSGEAVADGAANRSHE